MKERDSTREELERLGRALRTLSGSNRALLRAKDETSLLSEICRVVVAEACYCRAYVFRAEQDEAKSLTPLAHAGCEPGYVESLHLTWAETTGGQSATGTAVRTGEPCVVANIFTDPNLVPWRELARERGFASLLSLPLRVEGEMFGALTIAAPEPDAFGDEERRVLSEAAADLAFGLETLRIRQRRQQAEREIQRLNRALLTRAVVNRALVQPADEFSLLEDICRVAVEESGYRLAWVGYSERDDAKTVRPVAYYGFEDGFLALPRTWGTSERSRRLGESLERGEPWVVRDIVNDPDYPFRDEARMRGYGSMIALPLQIGGELAGALYILAGEPDAFDERETQLLFATASDLGFGINALRLRAKAAQAEETIKRMAYVDLVTGLPNRVRLRELLDEAIASAKEEHRPLALLRIEIERFREINETLGDREVEKLVKEVALRLEAAIGNRSTLARLGDCEFAVLLPRAGAEQANQLAHKILVALYEPVELSGLLLDVRASAGISLFPGHGAEADALIRRSSIALGHAKRSGSGHALFTGGLDLERAQRLSLLGDLRRAIESNELLLYCQPKMQIASHSLCGAEALVRWRHPHLGMINPGEFIKLAESNGLITPLTYWMLDASLRQGYAWREEGVAHSLPVNLSARDLRDPDLLERIKGSFATWGAQPDWIEFELTESALIEDPAGALDALTRLKQLDVKLSIDDFGTGYSSLSYLQRLPVDAIKIDQSFVSSMASSKDSETIVHSTIDLAHNLGLLVVAEGVEDQQIFDRLAALGCDLAQGYCIGRPLPADQFSAWAAQPGWH